VHHSAGGTHIYARDPGTQTGASEDVCDLVDLRRV
jgi:hypothetical protein